MKLNPEGVDKAVKVARQERDLGSNPCGTSTVEVIITTYFDHLKEAGLMREAGVQLAWGGHWAAHTANTPSDLPALIIRTDKE